MNDDLLYWLSIVLAFIGGVLPAGGAAALYAWTCQKFLIDPPPSTVRHVASTEDPELDELEVAFLALELEVQQRDCKHAWQTEVDKAGTLYLACGLCGSQPPGPPTPPGLLKYGAHNGYSPDGGN